MDGALTGNKELHWHDASQLINSGLELNFPGVIDEGSGVSIHDGAIPQHVLQENRKKRMHSEWGALHAKCMTSGARSIKPNTTCCNYVPASSRTPATLQVGTHLPHHFPSSRTAWRRLPLDSTCGNGCTSCGPTCIFFRRTHRKKSYSSINPKKTREEDGRARTIHPLCNPVSTTQRGVQNLCMTVNPGPTMDLAPFRYSSLRRRGRE